MFWYDSYQNFTLSTEASLSLSLSLSIYLYLLLSLSHRHRLTWLRVRVVRATGHGPDSDVRVNFFLICSRKLCGACFSWLCFNSKCSSVALECDSLIFWQWKCQRVMCMFCLNAQSHMEVLSRCAREWQPFKFAAFVGHTLHLIWPSEGC